MSNCCCWIVLKLLHDDRRCPEESPENVSHKTRGSNFVKP